MAEKDLMEKLLEDYPDVFADIFNALVFNGKQVIKDNELSDGMVHSQYKADDGKVHELERDTVKRWISNNIFLAILGTENQSESEKFMVTRVIGYDGSSYRTQVLNIDSEKRNLRKLHKEQKITDAEYIKKLEAIDEQIAPVVTIVLYFGTNRHWTAPTSLKELLNIPNGLEPFVNDYKIHVFEVAWLSDEQINSMTSDFKIVAQFFRDLRLGMHSVVGNTTKFRHKDEMLKLLAVFTRDLRFEEVKQSEYYKEMTNMCEIMDWVQNKGRNEGLNEGLNEGRNQMFMLWNWLQDSGRGDEAVEMMNSSDNDLLNALYTEYESSVQKKQ